MFEICKNPDDGTSDASQSDRYASDEEYPIGSTSVILGVKAGTEERKNYSEPDFAKLGGVCWTLLESLKSETRFTNSEIKHEGMKRRPDFCDSSLDFSFVSEKNLETTA